MALLAFNHYLLAVEVVMLPDIIPILKISLTTVFTGMMSQLVSIELFIWNLLITGGTSYFDFV